MQAYLVLCKHIDVLVAENERVRQEPKPREIKMAESHVISALVLKRSELCGEIISCRERIKAIEHELIHIDASIKIFAPEYDLRTVKGKRPYERNDIFKHGEVQRLSLEIMRESETPLSSRDITNKILALKNLEENTANIAKVQKHVSTMFRHKEDVLVRQVDRGSNGALRWMVI